MTEQHAVAIKRVHFASFDDRFCGSTERPRQFTVEPNEVTCPDCQSHDRLWLSPQGEAYLRSLEKARGETP